MGQTRQVVIVIGQGRSGTSVLANVLGKLGYKIPQPEIEADETNPRGFGESAWLVAFHQELLKKCLVQNGDARPSSFAETLNVVVENEESRSRARTWLGDQFVDADFLLLKDPRQLWFTTLWEDVADELGIEVSYATTLRTPSEVVASKQRWYEMGASAANSTASWINAMLYCERATRDRPRGFVEFSMLMSDWVSAVSQLDAQADLPPVRRAATMLYRGADKLVDPSLRRTTDTWSDLGVPSVLSDLADRVWDQLCELPNPNGPCRRFDSSSMHSAPSTASCMSGPRRSPSRLPPRHGGPACGRAVGSSGASGPVVNQAAMSRGRVDEHQSCTNHRQRRAIRRP